MCPLQRAKRQNGKQKLCEHGYVEVSCMVKSTQKLGLAGLLCAQEKEHTVQEQAKLLI